MHKINFHRLLIPLVGLILVGCVKTQHLSVTSINSYQWHKHEQKLQKLKKFKINGSITYISNKKKYFGRFFWKQYSEKNYRFILINPLGSIVFELWVKPTFAIFIDKYGKRWLSKDPQKIIPILTGICIPVDNLHKWILGLPGNSYKLKLDKKYLAKEINYRKDNKIWLVHYQSYTEVSSLPLPKCIELQTQEGKKRIKIKIDRWELYT